jgi:site-specific recombinase XerD
MHIINHAPQEAVQVAVVCSPLALLILGQGQHMNATDVRRSIHAFSAHLAGSMGSGDRTVKAYASDVKSFALFLDAVAGESEPIVGAGLIESFVAWLRSSRGNGPATIRRKVIALGSYFRWRIRSGLSTESPVEKAEIVVRVPKRLPRALARSDVALLLGRGDRRKPSQRRCKMDLALRLLLATGIRIGEMCAVDVGDIAPDGSAIRIKGKGDRERTVFVGNADLRVEVASVASSRRAVAGTHAALFLNRRSMRLSPQAFRLRLHRLVVQRGIETRITPHRLRHTAATLLIEEGVDIRFVQKLLGHASIATTELYTKVVDNSLRAALNRAEPLRHI